MSEASRNRTRLAGLAIGALFVVLAGKAGYLSLSGGGAPAHGDGAPDERVVRADIVDRNGELLATSVSAYSLVANPKLIWDGAEVAKALAGVLPDLDVEEMSARLSDQSREFVWVERGLPPRQRKAVFDLGLEGLRFEEESRRAYPRGTLAGHVLGYTNIDGVGAGGIEYSQNDRLVAGGEPVRLVVTTASRYTIHWRPATGVDGLFDAGHDILRAASQGLKKFEAKIFSKNFLKILIFFKKILVRF